MRGLALCCLLIAAPAGAADPGPAGPGAPAPVRTLKEAYRLALAESDAVASSAASLKEAEALWRATLGSSLPSLSLRHQTFHQDRAFGFNQRRTDEGMATVSWQGLTGYRELFALKNASATEEQQRQLLLRAHQLLLADVAAAYYGVLQAREAATATAELITLAERRLGELLERVRVGRTREADATGQEFQVEALRSQLVETERQARARADLLAFLVRAPVEPGGDSELLGRAIGPLEGYLEGVERRPDVRAAAKALDAARDSVHTARADRFPAFGLTGNHYAYRPPNRQGNDWDVSLSVSLPVFTFGAITGFVNAAKARAVSAEHDLRSARRSADLEIRNAHRDFAASARQLQIQGQAAAIAERDYQFQRRDERRGLVTSLEVLESLNRLNNARLARARSRLDVRLAEIGLETATGKAPEEILQ